MTPRVLAEHARNAEVDVANHVARQHEQICGMQVGVKHPVLERVAEKIVDDVTRKAVWIEARRDRPVSGPLVAGAERAEAVEHGDAGQELDHQRPPSREIPEHFRYALERIANRILPEAVRIADL